MKCVLATLALAVAAGCTTTAGPPLELRMAIPGAFAEPQPADSAALAADWWQAYGSAELSQLIAEALRSAPDVGPVLAAGIRGRLGDPNRFANLALVRAFSGM